MPPFRLALIQMAVGAVKLDNMARIKKLVGEAAQNGAKIVALPEMCNTPYGNNFFPTYAESIPGQSSEALAQAAKENQVFLIAGSIPERETDGRLFNTSTIFNPDGQMIAKHRKVHLFDIDIPGKITFQESLTLSPGSSLTTFDTPFCKVGVGICYDLRFAEMAQIYNQQGCQLIIYPGAFNMTTGPAHWELLLRARAVDNQLYVAAVSPARDETHSYVAWGHSSLVNPWGQVIASAEAEEAILYGDINVDYVAEVRQQIPILKQRRSDMYEVKALKPSETTK